MNFKKKNRIGIYIHIPYCLKKCQYCDFNSKALENREQLIPYVTTLKKDVSLSTAPLQGYSAKSIYFGGGTPSLLAPAEVFDIIEAIKRQIVLERNVEVTLEANPATLSLEKLSGYKKAGISRISLGVQSFQDKYLKLLGRLHNRQEALKTILLLRKSEFSNVSIDLMYGMPDQTLNDWQNDLNKFISLGLEHISFYDLKIERGTPFYGLRKKIILPQEQLQIKMYELGVKLLKKAGYRHYEISSFAKQKRESFHNQIYWKNESYLGMGAGSTTYFNNERFQKNKDIKEYIKEGNSGKFKQYQKEKLSAVHRLKETIALNFRLLSGFSLEKVERYCQVKAKKEIIDELQKMQEEGLIKSFNHSYKLSKKGILFYDTVASRILT